MDYNTTTVVREYNDRYCFFLLHRKGGYLKEMVYWQINNINDELVGTNLVEYIDVDYDEDEIVDLEKEVYLAGIVEINKILREVLNKNIDTILGLRCELGLAKRMIATEIEPNFPHFQLNYFNGCWPRLPDEYHCHLSEIQNFCKRNNSVRLGLMELCNCLIESYNKIELCTQLDQI